MPSAALQSVRRLVRWRATALVAFACLPFAGHAADAHRAVAAKPGDMVLLRNVAARPAARPAPPGMALMVSPSPRPEILASLGTDELSDAEFAQLGATLPLAAQLPTNTLNHTFGAVLVGSGRSSSTVAGNGVSHAIAAPVGAVGNATRGIGNQIQGALSQLPFGAGH